MTLKKSLLSAICLFISGTGVLRAENIVFPPGAGVVDVTLPPYNAKGDGKTDNTAAIQQALTDFAGRGIIYFPNGTYLISDTLKWQSKQTRNIFQGQSRDGAIIKLPDNAPGYGDPTNPKAMIWTGKRPAQRFRNGLRNLTIDSGKGNAGAIALQFVANNQGGIRDILIRSGDGLGAIGLDLGYTDEQGPCLITHVTVEGFDVGIFNRGVVDSTTFEDITVTGQNKVAVDNDGQIVTFRHLTTTGNVTSINNRGTGLVTLIDSELTGEGAASEIPAIVNTAGLFVRNVKTPGFASAIRNDAGTFTGVDGTEVDEFTSHAARVLFPTAPKSLNLPIKETPTVPWDDPATWTNVRDFGPPKPVTLIRTKDGKKSERFDWSEALQKAIDSGATTIYFPNQGADQTRIVREKPPASPAEEIAAKPLQPGAEPPPLLTGKAAKRAAAAGKGPAALEGGEYSSYGIYGPIHLRNKVRRIIGCESQMDPIVFSTEEDTAYQPEMRPNFILDDGEAPVVVVERFDSWYGSPRFEQRSKRSLVVSSLSFHDVETYPGTGDVFLDDVRCKVVKVNKSSLWGRQVNPEGHEDGRVVNDAGKLWILGLKTENDATIGKVSNGGSSEIVGAFHYANKDHINPKIIWINDNSSLSFGFGEWVTKRGRPFDVVVRETRDGVSREIRGEDLPVRGRGAMMVLYAGAPPSGTQKPVAPANLVAKSAGTDSIALSWDGESTGTDGVSIEMSKNGTEFTLLGCVLPGEKAFTASGLAAGGEYTFRVARFSGAGTAAAESVKTATAKPAPAGSGTGLTGKYYPGNSFRDLASTRVDGPLDFDWSETRPIPDSTNDRFSVRWTGQIEPRLSEVHTFILEADGHPQLWVDGKLVINGNPGSKPHATGKIALEAGRRVDIRLDYRHMEGKPLARLSWQGTNQEPEPVPATQLYPTGDPELPLVAISPAEKTVKESAGTVPLTLTRSGGSNAEALTVDLKTSGGIIEGTHFTLPSPAVIPAGADTVTVDLELIDNKKGDRERRLDIELGPSGEYLVETNRATVTIQDDDMPPAGNGTGLRGEYFVGPNFDLEKGGNVVPEINFGWDKKPPFPGIDVTRGFSIRWEGKVQPLFSETYTFDLQLGGLTFARLWVDGKPLVDAWIDNTAPRGAIALEAGKQYDIKIEVSQRSPYGASARLLWSSPSQFQQAIPETQLHPLSK